MADFIRTVTGDISPLELGYCQCHEHLLLAKGKSYTIDPSLCMDDEKKSADELLSYYAAGETVEITIQVSQNGQYEEQTVSVTLGAASDAEASQSQTQNQGSQGQDQQFGMPFGFGR